MHAFNNKYRHLFNQSFVTKFHRMNVTLQRLILTLLLKSEASKEYPSLLRSLHSRGMKPAKSEGHSVFFYSVHNSRLATRVSAWVHFCFSFFYCYDSHSCLHASYVHECVCCVGTCVHVLACMNTNVQCMYCACELIPMRVRSLFASVFEFLNFFLSIRYMV